MNTRITSEIYHQVSAENHFVKLKFPIIMNAIQYRIFTTLEKNNSPLYDYNCRYLTIFYQSRLMVIVFAWQIKIHMKLCKTITNPNKEMREIVSIQATQATYVTNKTLYTMNTIRILLRSVIGLNNPRERIWDNKTDVERRTQRACLNILSKPLVNLVTDLSTNDLHYTNFALFLEGRISNLYFPFNYSVWIFSALAVDLKGYYIF